MNLASTGFPAADRSKLVSAEDAVRLIRDGDTVATGGFVGVTCYTTSAFVHAKLGAALRDSDIPAHIFDSASEAQTRLAELVREPRGR